MKLILMLVAIYSLIFRQLYKEERTAVDPGEKLKEIKNNMAPSNREDNLYGNGFLFSGYEWKEDQEKSQNSKIVMPEGRQPFQYPYSSVLYNK